MPRPRNQQVDITVTPFYHVSARCVRRAYLCGVDKESGKSYEHRKDWLENRIRLLSTLFTIDVCAYAVMSNHYHIALKLTPDQAASWTDFEVLQRWRCLYKGSVLVQRYIKDEPLSESEHQTVRDTISVYRERLTDLSWFMRCLNEPIARQANKEDHCKGHFWESRFLSQGLRTERDVLACMAYVDLNPVRAQMADTPEQSEYTSIKERIAPTFDLQEAIASQFNCGSLRDFPFEVKPLMGFQDSLSQYSTTSTSNLSFTFESYLELVDWTGRVVRADKRGAISHSEPPILKRLNLNATNWLEQSTEFEALYRKGVFRGAS